MQQPTTSVVIQTPLAELDTTEREAAPPPALAGLRLLFATATFRPYGTNLLTPAGAGWLLIVTVLVLIMATSEAVAWGRMMSELSTGPLMPVFGVFVGFAVFAIVWGLDATLMTLDLAAPEYDRKLYGRTENAVVSRLTHVGGYLLRIGIVSASLFLTAPQLADMVFSTDIEQHIDNDRKAIADQARLAITARGAEREEALRTQLWEDRNLLEDELAGRSSGRRGYGPIARTIEGRIASAEGEIEEITSTRTEELAAFEAALLAHDAPVLQSRWGLVLPENSAANRRKALEALSADPSFQAAEQSIQGFLLLIFVSLFALKLFQPRAIKVYLSGALQNEYARYQRGEFDGWLPERERSTSGPHAMTPLRFEDLMLTVFPQVRADDMQRRNQELRHQILNRQLTDIDAVDQDLNGRLTGCRSEAEALYEQEMALVRDLEATRGEIERLGGLVAEKETALAEAEALTRQATPAEIAALVASRAALQADVTELRAQLREASIEKVMHETALSRAQERLAVLRSEQAGLQQQLDQSAERRAHHRAAQIRASDPPVPVFDEEPAPTTTAA